MKDCRAHQNSARRATFLAVVAWCEVFHIGSFAAPQAVALLSTKGEAHGHSGIAPTGAGICSDPLAGLLAGAAA
eukprot:4458654-Pyramimonas_sp.AAC.1